MNAMKTAENGEFTGELVVNADENARKPTFRRKTRYIDSPAFTTYSSLYSPPKQQFFNNNRCFLSVSPCPGVRPKFVNPIRYWHFDRTP